MVSSRSGALDLLTDAATRHDTQRRNRRTRRTQQGFSAGSARSALIVAADARTHFKASAMASCDEPHDAADQKSQPEERHRSRCVDSIAGSGANEKGRGAGKHDGGGPWVAPGAKRARAVRLPPPQHDQGETADEIIGGQI